MTLKNYFDQIGLNEIDRFINEGQEENINLEFKTVNHPNNTSESKKIDQKNISKCLSGFANSGGGIVIWGIKASKTKDGQDVAHSKFPIKQLKEFLNVLNTLEGQAVTPIVESVVHVIIDQGLNEGFIKTYIPASSNAPHMANYADKHYYKRSGDSFYQCEHYDIMDIISRKQNANLEIRARYKSTETIHQVRNKYYVVISIINTGNAVARYPYLAFNLSNGYQVVPIGLLGVSKDSGLKRVVNNLNYQANYSGGVDQVIYPNSQIDVDQIYIEVPIQQIPPQLDIDYLLIAENAIKKEGAITLKVKDAL